MLIKRLYNNKLLSVRSYNICKYNGLFTISDLIQFYNKHSTFSKLRNCGRKSNNELTRIYQGYKESVFAKNDFNTESTFLKLNLNTLQEKVVNTFILNKITRLKVRSKNAISKHLDKRIEFKQYLNSFFNVDTFQVELMSNIGKSSILEIEQHLDEIKEFSIKTSNINNVQELLSILNFFSIQNLFSINIIPQSIQNSRSVVEIFNFLFSQNVLAKGKYNKIFKDSIRIYHSKQPLSLNELVTKYHYSRERIRQLRNRFFDETYKTLLVLKRFEDNTISNLNLNKADNILNITSKLRRQINIDYNIDFSTGFIKYIISVYKSDYYSIVGNLQDVLIPKEINYRNRHNWKDIYLVKNNIISQIDITSMINNISLKTTEKINKTYKINFKDYLTKFLKNNNSKLIEEIKDDCEKIINKELNMFIDSEGNLIFQQNMLKFGYQYAYEALEVLSKSSSVEEITQKIYDLFPQYKTNDMKVRSCLIRKNGFVPIGRSSNFGLKKWEGQLEGFKGGTIRSIVKEYLDSKMSPIHISKITKYVKKYRKKTNERSILTNLRLDDSKVFIFFKESHVGVIEKCYDEWENEFTSTWDESFQQLKFFLKHNKNVKSIINGEYNSLYMWLNTQKAQYKRGVYSEERLMKLKDIGIDLKAEKEFADWKKDVKQLANFVKTNGVYPTRNQEVHLSFVHERLKIRYKENKLSQDQLELLKSLDLL